MKLAEIRRYPVKSMAGESVTSAAIDSRGLAGDRWYAVTDGVGRLGSGKNSRRFRRFDEIFSYRAAMAGGGAEVVGSAGSWRAGDPELDRVLSADLGAEVRIQRETGTPHQDAGQVSLVGTASLDWCREHLGVDGDPRRLRPNLVVHTTEPFVEESWAGAVVRIDRVELLVIKRIERCRMVDIAQDSLPVQPGWLKALGRERDLSLGMYAEVRRPGSISVGDRVEALPMTHSPA